MTGRWPTSLSDWQRMEREREARMTIVMATIDVVDERMKSPCAGKAPSGAPPGLGSSNLPHVAISTAMNSWPTSLRDFARQERERDDDGAAEIAARFRAEPPIWKAPAREWLTEALAGTGVVACVLCVAVAFKMAGY